MKKLFYLSTSILLSFFICLNKVYANTTSNKNNINILSWWGYLSSPEVINRAERKCGTKISFDEYFSNDEFLRRLEAHKDSYDILIFADTIYNSVKDKIPNFTNSPLSQQSKDYNPTIKSHYNNMDYPHNVVYFFHSMTGILWNPKNIALSHTDSITSIFRKAKQNYVVMIDDPVDANKLIKAYLNESKKSIQDPNALTISNFKKMIQDANVYITNNYSQIYNNSQFSFALSWSGEALINLMKINNGYKFLIHPKVSYISSDLIAQTSSKESALCVATFLTSKNTMMDLQKKDFYFTPYADYSNILNPIFKDTYKQFVMLLPTLYWIDSRNDKYFQKINMAWQLVKISLNNQLGR